jgi:hypothetical protein
MKPLLLSAFTATSCPAGEWARRSRRCGRAHRAAPAGSRPSLDTYIGRSAASMTRACRQGPQSSSAATTAWRGSVSPRMALRKLPPPRARAAARRHLPRQHHHRTDSELAYQRAILQPGHCRPAFAIPAHNTFGRSHTKRLAQGTCGGHLVACSPAPRCRGRAARPGRWRDRRSAGRRGGLAVIRRSMVSIRCSWCRRRPAAPCRDTQVSPSVKLRRLPRSTPGSTSTPTSCRCQHRKIKRRLPSVLAASAGRGRCRDVRRAAAAGLGAQDMAASTPRHRHEQR